MAKDKFKNIIQKYFLFNLTIPLIVLLTLFVLANSILNYVVLTKLNKDTVQDIQKLLYKTNNNYIEYTSYLQKNSVILDYIDSTIETPYLDELYINFNSQQTISSTLFLIKGDGTIAYYIGDDESDFQSHHNIERLLKRIDLKDNQLIREVENVKSKGQYNYIYLYGRKITTDKGNIGYLILVLSKKDLEKICFNKYSTLTLITDEFNNVIATSNDIILDYIGKFIPKYTSYNTCTYNDTEFFIKTVELPNSNLNIFSLTTLYTPFIYSFWFFIFGLLIILLFVLLSKIITKSFTDKITSPIDNLLKAMKEFEYGNLNCYVDIKSDDEFKLLGDQFNSMLTRINHLIALNQELSELQKMAEIKQLQSQFNPHLIFNVLETLKYTIITDTQEAQNIILTLSSILRFNLDKTQDFVTLEKDSSYILDYLKLHKYRFKENLQFNINLSHDLANLTIPKLMIQPIVENSIKYGFKKKKCIRIDLSFAIKDNALFITIKDNAGGIKQSKLDKINSANSLEYHNDLIGFGLYNINKRITYLYGNEYGLEMSNNENGLTSTVKLPIIREEGKENV